MHPLSGAHRHSFTPPLCRTSQYRYGTILETLCSIVWIWRVLRAEPKFFCWNNLLFLFSLHCFSLSSFHLWVVWGWGLRTDSVLSSSLALQTLFNNKTNNNNMLYCYYCSTSWAAVHMGGGYLCRGQRTIFTLTRV